MILRSVMRHVCLGVQDLSEPSRPISRISKANPFDPADADEALDSRFRMKVCATKGQKVRTCLITGNRQRYKSTNSNHHPLPRHAIEFGFRLVLEPLTR